MNRYKILAVSAAVCGMLSAPARSQDPHEYTWGNQNGGNWNEITPTWEWDEICGHIPLHTAPPHEAGEAAILNDFTGDPDYIVTMDMSPSIDWLEIRTNLATLNMDGNTLTLLAAHDLENDGTINVDGGATLMIDIADADANVTLTGTGELVMLAAEALMATAAGDTLTNDANHIIRGQGEISATLVNNGEVHADVAAATLTLNGSNKTNNGLLTAENAAYLEVAVSTLTNDGTIEVKAQADLKIDGNVTLSGGGYLDIQDPDSTIFADPGNTLTNGADHTIHGRGEISVALENDGMVRADDADETLELRGEHKTNSGYLIAENNATLKLSGFILTNTDGVLAANGGTIDILDGTSIDGGTLDANTGSVINADGTIGISDVRILGIFHVMSGATVDVTGSITNDGTIEVDNGATLAIDSAVSIQEGGVVRMLASDSTISIGAGGSLTNGAYHDIRGQGSINGDLTNDGEIRADDSNGSLNLTHDGTVTNNGVLYAQNNGTLVIDVAHLANTNGKLVAAGGVIQINDNTNITGGTLETTGGSVSIILGRTISISNVTNQGSGRFRVDSGNTVTVTGSTLTNNGTIEIGDGSVDQTILAFDDSITLAGTGGVYMLNDDARITTNGGYTLTNDVDHTIHGQGSISASLTNNGEVCADESGEPLALTDNAKTNNGLMKVTNGAILEVSANVDGNGGWTADGGGILLQPGVVVSTTGSIAVQNGGSLDIVGADMSGEDLWMDQTGQLSVGSTVTLSDDLDFAMTDETDWMWISGSKLLMTGEGGGCHVDGWAALEVGGEDQGSGGSGVNNFGLADLEIAAGAGTALVDLRDNGNRDGADEVLYVESLTFGVGAKLNLNGLKLYEDGVPVEEGSYGGAVIDEPVVTAPLGDVNTDDAVNGLDIQLFVAVYLGDDLDPDHICIADMNGDELVNDLDLELFIARLITE